MRLVGLAVLGVALAGLAAPVAGADPVIPVDPVVPVPEAAPLPAPEESAVVAQSAPVTPPEGTSHLPSPDSLPPGTTTTAPEHSTLDYLKDVWQALRSKDVTASDALLLLAQRPVDNAKVAGSVPQNQTGPVAPPAPAAPPAAEAPVNVEPTPILPAPVVDAAAPVPAG